MYTRVDIKLVYLDVFLQVEMVRVVFQVLKHVLGRHVRFVFGAFVRESRELHDFFRQIRSANKSIHRIINSETTCISSSTHTHTCDA